MSWGIVVFTVISVYYLDRWENRRIKTLFDWVPAILLAYILPAGISTILGEDFSQAEIHRYSSMYFIPLAIVAVMSSLPISHLKLIGWRPIAVFVVGSFWIAVFPVFLAFQFMESSLISELFINQEYWKGIPPIVGSWIGGSTSQIVLKELVECPEHIFLTVLVLDNILVNIWTILMFQGIKKSDKLNKLLNITNVSVPEPIEKAVGKRMHAILTFFILLIIVFVTNSIIENFVTKIIFLSVLGLVLSNWVRSWNFNFALKIGSVLILIVMAVLGLKLNFSIIHIEFGLLGFLVVWLVSHFLIMLVAAKILRISTAWVSIASMANVGGIATAPAVTAAYEKKWMPHAIILAILSMATGTFWGMLTIYLFKTFLIE